MNKLVEGLMTKLWQPKIWLIAAIIVFLVQLFVPAYMIAEQQQTLKHGELYKFKIRPIDPYDPFRGRYVTLSFDAERDAFVLDGEKDSPPLQRNDWVYAKLIKDQEGFAKFSGLTLAPPSNGNDYLRLQVRYRSSNDQYHINIPFDRYYAPDNKAYAIETNVRQRTRRNSDDQVYVAVKIRKGKGTIEDLLINEVPILQFVENQQGRTD
ncbi:GDYXXLXY domain-containing protein [Kangiella sp. TOML190]|uniref:GDYXXLXY domain-containing protein n=1 Tax=Kangiella sp. TOML190 TaxID=2931351 RepID=UPI0020403E20|nr:GDYXXLXY domain-containing protein [Kangiella sp. TOML190]